ncbi:hypothetical protein A2U01_0106203, partial [Trifolium medium]|nr:hypothetical protein [Trifolium medium]
KSCFGADAGAGRNPSLRQAQ